jgi:hypothetical protein
MKTFALEIFPFDNAGSERHTAPHRGSPQRRTFSPKEDNQMRDIRFSTFSLLLVLAASLTVPALAPAQDNSGSNPPTVFSHDIAHSNAPPMMMTVIGFTNASVGIQVKGFPCMGGTSGCADQTPGTIALSAPMAVVMRGSKVTYTFEFEDVSYTGPCSLAFVLLDGTTKLDSGQYKFPSGCKPNTVYFASFDRILKMDKKMGVGTLKGTLKGGTHTDSIRQNFCFM